MTEAFARGRWNALAWGWLLVVAALAVHQAGFWREARLDSDVMALLPGETDDALLRAANARLAGGATRQVVVLVGAEDWPRTQRAADAFIAALDDAGSPVTRLRGDDASLREALSLYEAHRRGLLTPAQRAQLEDPSTEALALARLFAPGTGGIGAWRDDPLGLWTAWWQARSGAAISPRDGLLAVRGEDRDWALVRLESRVAAFQLDGERHLQAALDAARAAAVAAAGTDVEMIAGGVPLHAEAAAVRARTEVGTIGLGSLLAVVGLVWLAFRSPRPILMVAVSLLVGTAAGLSVTALVFGQVHLLTLVFGASLVGVAEDYGIHWFASRQAQPGVPPRTMMRRLLPALSLALVTSALAYLALGIAPFPGLRQMAVFSAAGLAAAFLTVALWFPWLDGAAPRPSPFAEAVGRSLARWPRLSNRAPTWLAALALVAVIGTGLPRLSVNDDLRSLQSSPPALLAQEARLGRLLGLPSPAQFFVVEGHDAEQVREREEALVDRLADLSAGGHLGGWRAVSDWLPSAARQREDAARVQTIEGRVLARAAGLLGEAPPAARTDVAPALALDAWLAHPVSAPMRPLWLGSVDGRWGSVVLLEGLSPERLPALAQAAEGLPGVRWIDRSATISGVLAHYRHQMSLLLVAGYLAVALALWLRFGRRAWRAWLPTALAATLSLAMLGWLGVPLQLFGVLAQLLLLGVGIDYGIFLLEHRDDPASWLAVSLGAASTLLAFGLLALSATPALHSFGLALLLGIGIVWLITPCFRPAPRAAT
ncbi:MAG TPA: MMPL family transporter [Arenimonas sp.]|uniref:MMPL family transporter n=1 Tax=Arenimonas sp. TaxID=1872635 RepID=UPI002D80C817|nr:MMPL family transporter [Arenimonas sp.]HEU0153714.1 MMPL family transporter [Arenimonas sp.]